MLDQNCIRPLLMFLHSSNTYKFLGIVKIQAGVMTFQLLLIPIVYDVFQLNLSAFTHHKTDSTRPVQWDILLYNGWSANRNQVIFQQKHWNSLILTYLHVSTDILRTFDTLLRHYRTTMQPRGVVGRHINCRFSTTRQYHFDGYRWKTWSSENEKAFQDNN